MSLWILSDASGTTVHGASLTTVPNGPSLMKKQPAVHSVSGNSRNLSSNTPVPPVRSQPTVDGASGNVQVATTSRLQTPQEVNLTAHFALTVT